MQLLSVVEAQDAVFHVVRRGVLAEDEGEMATGALNATGSVEFWKESNQHAVSLTKRDGEKQEPRKRIMTIVPKGT
jgi:hypothetical protein